MLNKNIKANGTPYTLIKQIIRSNGIPLSKLPISCFYLFRSFLDLPFNYYESLFLSQKIFSTHIKEDPIFIIGHYRSGTTLLNKLLVQDKQFGYVSDYDLIFPFHNNMMQKIIMPILQIIIKGIGVKHKWFNNYVIDLNDPNEEEGFIINSLSPYAVYWGYIFPTKADEYLDRFIFFKDSTAEQLWKSAYSYYLKKITRKKMGKRLLIKSPVNSARIKPLLDLFPNAKFIFLYRNPYFVYHSMEKLWRDCIEKYFSLQKISNWEREKIIFSHYKKLMKAYERDKNLIPSDNLFEIRYEDLINDPLLQIEKLYEHFNLPDFNIASENISKRINKEDNYKTSIYNFDHQKLNRIDENLLDFINKWNYSRPD